MRKSLVAIALACAFPAAFAQSSVTLYGILDAGIEVLDAGSTTATRLQGSGMWSGNRFGVRGSDRSPRVAGFRRVWNPVRSG